MNTYAHQLDAGPARRGLRRRAAWLALALLAACTPAPPRVAAQEPAADAACSLDGMVLRDFPGPKAQIQYAEGKPDFFCDLMELFSVVLTPEQKRSQAGLYVQDMAKADWNQPSGHWIEARSAFYVVGSRKLGSMGPTFASFASRDAAAGFAAREGGKVLAFAQITRDMVSMGGNAAHDTAMGTR